MLETVQSENGLTTSPHYLASEAGRAIIRDGGNAVEACVAMAACLAVVYPHMTGLGGDGFWTIRKPSGDVFCIDACGRAARLADLTYYQNRNLDTIPTRGPDAANTVAGTVSGWQLALEQSDAKLPLDRLFRDAVRHAKDGVAVTQSGATIAAEKDAELCGVSGYADIFKPGGGALKLGDTLKQSALATTLERLAKKGLSDFYVGELANDICEDLAAAGSALRAKDFAAHAAKVTQPLSTRLSDATLYNTPPPTQGLSSLLILALAQNLDPGELESFEHLHSLVESTKRAFIYAKDKGLGDPEHMIENWQDILSDDAQLKTLSDKIDTNRALPWPHVSQPGDTTWFGACDADGWMVSAIQSTYFEFGSGVVLPTTGLIWQNRGSSFSLQPGWNALQPGRQPFHTLNPALAAFDDGRVMAYGTMGGEGQPQTQAALFSRYAHFGQDLQSSITAPRWLLGRTWGEQSVTLKLESRFEDNVVQRLRAVGHTVEIVEPFDQRMGHAGALVRHSDGKMFGATDPRSDGKVCA